NFPYLRAVLPDVLQALSRISGGRLHIVSNAPLNDYIDHPIVIQSQWSAASELQSLQSFDVGLMPLPDTPSTRGKCGFKILQYLSVGVPVIASNVGANTEIMSGCEAGHLLRKGEEWGPAIASLASSSIMRSQMGRNGRRRVETTYSVRAALPCLEHILRSTRKRRLNHLAMSHSS